MAIRGRKTQVALLAVTLSLVLVFCTAVLLSGVFFAQTASADEAESRIDNGAKSATVLGAFNGGTIAGTVIGCSSLAVAICFLIIFLHNPKDKK